MTGVQTCALPICPFGRKRNLPQTQGQAPRLNGTPTLSLLRLFFRSRSQRIEELPDFAVGLLRLADDEQTVEFFDGSAGPVDFHPRASRAPADDFDEYVTVHNRRPITCLAAGWGWGGFVGGGLRLW